MPYFIFEKIPISLLTNFKKIKMKRILLLFIILTTGIAFSQTIPNGGFENWTTSSFAQPTYFTSSNAQNGNGVINPGNIIKTTDAYHGSYAVKMNTVLIGSDTIFGYVTNGNPGNSSTWQGGVPYSFKPSGFRIYYKSTIIGTDSALVLIQFKKSGSAIGTYVYKVSNSQSNYTLFSKSFSPALSMNPDTIVFAAASSNAMAHSGTPGNMFQIDSLSFTGVPAQPNHMNGDFELWQNQSFTVVNGWDNQNCNQTTDKYSGTYALELQTAAPSFGGGGGNQPGNAITGVYGHQSGPKGGHPYTKQIDTLFFYYKYLPADPSDSAQISISFKKNGSQFMGTSMFFPQANTYTAAKIPFDITWTGTIPDSAIISIQSSKNWPPPASFIGSDLKIDNMYLGSQRLPVANFIAPATGCVGVPIQLIDNSANMVTSWNWIMSGASPSGSSILENPVISYNTAGTHTIKMNATNSFGTSSNFSLTINIYANPSISATAPTICLGNTTTVTANGASTYTWNTGATTATISVSPTVSTTYSIIGTDVHGCIDSTTTAVTVLTPPTPNICMVTVDSLSINNIIYWDKISYTNVDSFIIHREVTSGVYKRIGAQAYNVLSQFIDTARSIGAGLANGDPNKGTYRYKLQTVDTCGNYSTLSPYHNTIFISHNTSGVFSWTTPYTIEGQVTNPIANYILFCDTANINVWTPVSVVTGSQQTAVDTGYMHHANIANWRVDATGFSCNPTARLAGGGLNNPMAAKAKSHSNQNTNRNQATGIKVQNANQVNVYPNPASSVLNIGFAYAPAGKVTIKVISIIGSEIFSQTYNQMGTNIALDISKYESGAYLVQITTDNLSEIKKIVKQ